MRHANNDMIKRVIIKKTRSGAVRALTLLLMILYISGTTSIEILHSMLHNDQVTAVAHTQTEEQDPCHRIIYHNDTEHGCDDDSHLATSDKCEMCDVAFHADQTGLPDVLFNAAHFFNAHFSLYKENLDSYCAVIASSRAPPFLV